jgi:glycosyltransferase involved in cell wall biosynthesis
MYHVSGSVSIVIPTKNRGNLLLEAVRSALEVKPRPLEVIVVDGGSTDGSLERLDELGDQIRLLRGKLPNAGATRNAGAAIARGDYLGFLDSDDTILPDKIGCLGRALDGDSTLGLVHGRTIVVDTHGWADQHATARQERAFQLGERVGTTFDGLALYCAMFTSATLIRRQAFHEIGGYDESLDAYEDWDLYLRISRRWRLGYEGCVSARYRIWPGNVAWDRTALGVIRVAEKHLADLPDLTTAAAHRARYGFLRRLAESNHVLVRPSETRRAAFAAARLSPLRALADKQVRGPLLRSFVPAALLRRRRPARPPL